MDKILIGKPVAQSIIENIVAKIAELNTVPTMSLVKIGSDSASDFYIKNIVKNADKLGMQVLLSELSESTTQIELTDRIIQDNNNSNIHGIMIQKPLPKQIDTVQVDNIINPMKDIDGIHPINIGKLFLSQDCFTPCTAAAVIELIRFYNIETSGKHVVILGRSAIVAKPLAGLLLQKSKTGNATVTICHSYTKNLEEITNQADILIAAIGRANFITSDLIKKNAICLDVGINLVKNEDKGDIYVGDFDYLSCYDKASAITPVPGGIGTITTSLLLNNLVDAAVRQTSKEKN